MFPPTKGDGYLKWKLPAFEWSEHDWEDEDIIIIYDLDDKIWCGWTKKDQCVLRDLDYDEINLIRLEFNLNVTL